MHASYRADDRSAERSAVEERAATIVAVRTRRRDRRASRTNRVRSLKARHQGLVGYRIVGSPASAGTVSRTDRSWSESATGTAANRFELICSVVPIGRNSENRAGCQVVNRCRGGWRVDNTNNPWATCAAATASKRTATAAAKLSETAPRPYCCPTATAA